MQQRSSFHVLWLWIKQRVPQEPQTSHNASACSSVLSCLLPILIPLGEREPAAHLMWRRFVSTRAGGRQGPCSWSLSEAFTDPCRTNASAETSNLIHYSHTG
ncbi:hypothetical protein AAFF_G00074370 [Aldrovandia affinis]|uniref:Uncharacterized protein n=1 Tax=Aldrovandia affinis TaxID=143900 RepID=A0AAD7RYA5_9TELE|nr:hypothetical protein AAFF_G00074370 [Aldrovandia affinis]